MSQMKGLQEFLAEAELDHYYEQFKRNLKVHTVPQIKYVQDEDLLDIGMSKPEMRRLHKYFKKECPQGAFSKLRKLVSTSQSQRDGPGTNAHRENSRELNGQTSLTPPAVEPAALPLTSPTFVHRAPGKHIIPAEDIQVTSSLGNGEFGTVEEGIWKDGSGQQRKVAIKTLSRDKMEIGVGDFLKEAGIMHSLSHDHLVTLYGVVLAPDKLMLITELAPNRSLLECLRNTPNNFPVSILCNLAVQVCDAMAYLERRRLIHRDLAARNLLVYKNDYIKISDFGLSRALTEEKDYYQTEYKPTLKLPLAWCAPECINYLRFTSASDMWSFAVTLWEMFSYGEQPWAGLTGQEILNAIDEPNSERLAQPDCCPTDVYSLMLRCWAHDPESRPKFSELLLALPSLKPEQVQAREDIDRSDEGVGWLRLTQGDIITVLDKNPQQAPRSGVWKGVLRTGQTGYFKAGDTIVYMEVKAIAGPAPKLRPSASTAASVGNLLREKLARKAPARSATQRTSARRLDPSMISAPQNDLRHTCHIGYDGAVFGDLSFMGNDVDKLPIKLPGEGAVGSVHSLTRSDETDSESQGLKTSRSESLLQGSLLSQDSRMTMSVYPGSSSLTSNSIDTDTLDDFKMPDFSSDFDVGSSLFDEILQSLSVTNDKESSPTEMSDVNDKSPLLEKDICLTNGKSSFDNIAMVPNDKDTSPPRERHHSHGASSLSSGNSFDATHPPAVTEEKTGWKPKLKIDVDDPEDEEFITGKHRSGIRKLSESEEREFDEAVEVANQFARTSHSGTPSPHPEVSPTPDSRGRFNFRHSKKDAAPPGRETLRSFSEEIERIRAKEPEVSEEAQLAYNLLITKGGIQDTKINRSTRAPRSANLNIREPQGIPGRKVPDGEVEVANPLRRLREGVVMPNRAARRPPALPPEAVKLATPEKSPDTLDSGEDENSSEGITMGRIVMKFDS